MTSTDPIERSWDLSLYELHRTPQEAITDETEIAVSARSLQSELTCPICLDMLTNTMTTKECLHRFVFYIRLRNVTSIDCWYAKKMSLFKILTFAYYLHTQTQFIIFPVKVSIYCSDFIHLTFLTTFYFLVIVQSRILENIAKFINCNT